MQAKYMNDILDRKHYDIRLAWESGDFDDAFNMAWAFLKEDSTDVSALYTVAAYYCSKGEFDVAKRIFINLIELIDASNIHKLEYILCSLIRIEFNLGNFEAAYDYLNEAKLFFPRIESETEKLSIFLENRLLGIDFADYDSSECLQHILDKHSSYSYGDFSCCDHTIFNDSVDINKLFYNASLELGNVSRKNEFDALMPSYNLRLNDTYFCKLANCGFSLNSSTDNCDYVKIITIPFSKKIISMYPCFNVPLLANEFEFKGADDVMRSVNKLEEPSDQIKKFYKRWKKQ